ncbi:MAG TPA: hypothetical protein VLX92_11565 [Kofleriaceae bacterium]|nr:hypothetical protein [Kofleriaceae bacterium]
MSKIADQVHTKFKLFVGTLDTSGNLGSLAGEVAAWARTAKAAPKSIGIEFLERSHKVMLSVGYRDDEAPYGIELRSAKIAKVGALDPKELGQLERAMADAAAKDQRVICHELYVTDSDELFVVTMSHVG